ncbi:MAG: amylo-alpha-1,6-glucosidase [bacterium]
MNQNEKAGMLKEQMQPSIHIDRNILNDFSQAIELEWIETNGLGGYASSTVVCANTRRYHGILVSSGQGLNRFVLLSRLEEFLIFRGMRYDLSCNQYRETIHPGGHLLLAGFDRYPFPTFYYEFDHIRLKKEIFMPYGEETTVILYTLLTPGQGKLHIRPLIACRDYHSLTRENPALDPTVMAEKGKISLHPYPGMPTLIFHLHDGSFTGPPYWYRDFLYCRERERGLEEVEDLFSPGECILTLSSDHPVALVVTSGERDPDPPQRIRDREVKRREQILSSLEVRNTITESLALAADQFIIREKTGRAAILAGYPWFTDWGRDTMISLDGLLLCTGRHDEAKEILASYARLILYGLIPNRIVEGTGGCEYNTVDGSLLYLNAVDRYLKKTGDTDLLKSLFPLMEAVIQKYRGGTRFRIGMDPQDKLIYAGEPGLQLTWMDAKVGNWVVTPRMGKPVEVNALWHHALRRMASWAESLGIKRDYTSLAEKVRDYFNRRFWYSEGGFLYDVIDTDHGPDPSLRPNQILAVSLDSPLISRERAVRVMELVRRKLLTPFGLRSLNPDHPAYRKRYEGGPWERDSAYHQGTVWAWLIGPYIDACIKVLPDQVDIRILEPLIEQLKVYGIGTIGEIFDGDPPHKSGGCPAQAWSVAEVLRGYLALRNHLKVNKKKNSLT